MGMRQSHAKTIRILLAVAFFLATIPAVSAVPYRTAFEQYDLINIKTKELNLPLMAKIQFVIDQNRFNMADYVPLNGLPQTDNGVVIGRRILKHTLQNWLDDYKSNEETSGWIRSAESASQAMSTSIDSNGHKFSLRIKPIETTAEVIYTGIVKAKISYDVGHSEALVEVAKNVGNTTYAYTHIKNSEDTRDVFGVRWSF